MKSFRLILPAALVALAVIITGCPKPPAAPEQPWGPASAARNTTVACSTRTADPEAGEVAFQFDWGDGSQSEWSALRAGSAAFGDTHTYTLTGSFSVRARAKTARSGASEWSDPFILRVEVGEGELLRRFGLPDPEEPEDSADFSFNTFALGTDGRSYVGSEWGFLFRTTEGRRDKEFITRDYDGFYPAPTLSEDGAVYIACENDSLYAFNTDGTRRWTRNVGDEVMATAALGSDGAIYIQTVSDSLYAYGPDGTRRWSFPSNGFSSPVIGPDGTVYACNDEGSIFAIEPGSGAQKNLYVMGGSSISASPALDPGRNRLYVADEEGTLIALNLTSFTPDWDERIGPSPSSPVIGTDGTVYIGTEGKLVALNPADGMPSWTFQPTLAGILSTPAVSSAGLVYVIVSGGRKDRDRAFEDVDSLYAVNADGSRRWAVGLDFGAWDDLMSAPKVDDAGYIYFGNGYYAWVVRGLGGPAASSWPMFQRDGQNTGRAR